VTSKTTKEHYEKYEKMAREHHVGHRYYQSKRQTVIVFFNNKPNTQEIMKRRQNGFLGAEWFELRKNKIEVEPA